MRFGIKEISKHAIPWLPGLVAAMALTGCGEAHNTFVDVGVAKIDITPKEPIRLSGYRVRREPTADVAGRLWAKALAIGSDKEGPAILITLDLVGITRTITDALAERLSDKAGVSREKLAVCVTHTHSGPCVRGNLPYIFGEPIPAEHQEVIDRYAAELERKLEEVALQALENRRPGQLAWARGEAKFAANRRSEGGREKSSAGDTISTRPVDHDLPALFVTDREGELRGVLVSYACHCTTVGGTFNRIHGEWAGAAAEIIEERRPGVIGMVAIGCGADQNPNPRGLLPEVEHNGRQIADEVERLWQGATTPLTGAPVCRYRLTTLPFGKVTEADLNKRLEDQMARVRYYAGIVLERMKRGVDPPTTLEYPVQTWTFGDDLAMVFLAGEVVVDYSLRLKRELDPARLWINAYSNDVPCYIASKRVIGEGGYEVDESMDSYDKPTRFDPAVEDIIIREVRELVPESFVRE